MHCRISSRVLAAAARRANQLAVRSSRLLSSRVSTPVVASSSTSSSSSSSSFPCRLFHLGSSTLSSAPLTSPAPGAVIDFNLADIGEGITECEILKWFIKEGDSIAQFDKVCEVQSDKANVEITSRYDGVVKGLKYAVGDLAKVGQPLFTIQIAGEASADAVASTPAPAPAAAAKPAAAPKAAPAKPAAAAAAVSAAPTPSPAEVLISDKVLTSPAVRRIAREENVNLSYVTPTGPNGRILKEDVLNYIKAGRPSAAAPAVAPAAAAAPAVSAAPAKPLAPPAGYLKEDKEVAITGLNRIMVQTMTAANAVPQLGYGDEICMDALVELRSLLNKEAQARYGVKLSYMPFIIKAASLALKQFPQLNAHTNADCSNVTYRSQHNIGLAMDTPRGLLVPNIKDVANKSIIDIALDMQRLSKLGSEGKLGRDELTGGTFTISNIGTIGGTYLKPILVVPEVVIGAIGAMQTLPRFDNNMNVKPTKVMNISWSADHRVVDGATMAKFSNQWKHYIENPAAMMMETK